MLSEEERAGLQEVADALARANARAGEPQPVCRAFARALRAPGAPRFTMQAWIELEAARSPLLEGRLPEAEEAIAALEAALAAFRLPACGGSLGAAEALDLLDAMLAEILHGFGMALRMRPPGEEGGWQSPDGDSGFGLWLPVYACLTGQLGLSPAEAAEIEVGQAFALIAADKLNRGWTPEGATYRQREALAETEHADRNAEEAAANG